MKTAISSLANSDPAHSREPPPNGRKLLFAALLLGQLPRPPLFCTTTKKHINNKWEVQESPSDCYPEMDDYNFLFGCEKEKQRCTCRYGAQFHMGINDLEPQDLATRSQNTHAHHHPSHPSGPTFLLFTTSPSLIISTLHHQNSKITPIKLPYLYLYLVCPTFSSLQITVCIN